ncbi:hypothetical protein P279_30800 [Rhodobacteraceae bacterium PD-2]|nr:hypothetical protein P279_30800 [Rhodobacteraceae bacterium PD-2]
MEGFAISTTLPHQVSYLFLGHGLEAVTPFWKKLNGQLADHDKGCRGYAVGRLSVFQAVYWDAQG